MSDPRPRRPAGKAAARKGGQAKPLMYSGIHAVESLLRHRPRACWSCSCWTAAPGAATPAWKP
ncbi:hypothetical protein ASALC70_02952 [Alcanivorax sp. ALC70]|nr:hypothetical protein ASALC70_02952 [Alcanivorax sp. ALC70]